MLVPLHIYSEYSLQESCIKIEQLTGKAAALGYKTIALTDHNTMAGFVEFDHHCRRHKLKPIFGLEIDVEGIPAADRLILFAKDNQGYKNLLYLASQPKPLSLQVIHKFSSGLICLVNFHKPKEALASYNQLLHIFNRQDLYVELMLGSEAQRHIAGQLVEIFPANSFVAARCISYLEASDVLLIKILRAMKANLDPQQVVINDTYLTAPAVFEQEYKEFPQAVNNTSVIAGRCRVKLSKEKRFPQLPEKRNLKELAWQGATTRYHKLTNTVSERLAYELSVIEEMGLSDYFLIVADIVAYARKAKIPIGPGRGSAAGSLTAYCLHITDIDPLAHNLFFERFLNKQRQNLPDIDLDICHNRRDELIDYVVNRFGKDYTAKIGAYGTFGYTNAVKEVKKLPSADVSLAKKLVGIKQYFTTHAAGLIITPDPVINYSAVESQGSIQVTQLTMDRLENIGVLKIDLLGLRNLTVLNQIEKLIRAEHSDFALQSIPYSDAETCKLLSKGATLGIFQLEGALFRHLLPQIKPQSFTDLIAILALGRPGPLKQIPSYIKRRKGQEPISYVHSRLKPILEETYGLMIYQEQVMQVVHEIAGFSLEEADLLRAAIGKKNRTLIKDLRQKFLSGCRKNGLSLKDSTQLYLQIERFAGYAFNKAHSAAYAVITWQLAYLKTHYPYQFYKAQINNIVDTAKSGEFYQECHMRGINVLPPDVRYSEVGLAKEGDALRIGLAGLKYIGPQVAKDIVAIRSQQQYTSLTDFLSRTKLLDRTKHILAYAGSLDGFGSRRDILEVMGHKTEITNQELLEREKEIVGIYHSGHPIDKWKSLLEELKFYLGDYSAGHILDIYKYSRKLVGLIAGAHTTDRFSLSLQKSDLCNMLQTGMLTAIFGKRQGDHVQAEWVLPLRPMMMLKPKLKKSMQLQRFLKKNHGSVPVLLDLGGGTVQLVAPRYWIVDRKEIVSQLTDYTEQVYWIDP